MGRRGLFLKNAVVLTAATLALRLIGMVFRVVISNQLGAEGMGLYQIVVSVYTLASTLGQMGLRTSSNGGELSRIGVLMDNLNVILAKKSYLLLLGACGLATLLPALRAAKRGIRVDLRALCLLLPALAVCLWYLVMANHSFDHTYYTYRNAAVMVFAGFAFLACALKRGNRA